GNGVGKDLHMAKQYFKKAADMGLASAYFNLGLMYHNGQSVEKDLQKAKEYVKKACKIGYADACNYF
ncbi:tetratricopeptide repeat protein, partial [Helicobacter suis]|uniref:tetratricopeptide repeat protein n=1 Tax=Helicobacter suis TaxID=104628 RepID=UPI0035A25205